MKLAGAVCPALAAAAMVLLAGCASGTDGKAGAASAGGPNTSAVPSNAAGSNTSAVPSNAAGSTASAVVVPSTLTAIAPSPAASSALAQAKADESKFPKAKLYPPSARPAEVSIAYVGVSGSARYIDAYAVAFLCGGGVPDDCISYVGAPEYRIPLAPDARFTVLGADMAPNQPADFARFRTVAQGPDGTYRGNFDLFDITYTAGGQAASLTMEYTP